MVTDDIYPTTQKHVWSHFTNTHHRQSRLREQSPQRAAQCWSIQPATNNHSQHHQTVKSWIKWISVTLQLLHIHKR